MILAQNISMATTDGLLPAGEYVLLSFTDNGLGMSEAVRQRAFEPLFTIKSQDAGTGPGLSQVLSTCEQSGGSARIDSSVGKGTTVPLYLPKSRQPAKLSKSLTVEHPGSEIVSSTKSVLLLEDNEGVAAGIQAVLETFGCLVQHQLTADAAYAALESGGSST